MKIKSGRAKSSGVCPLAVTNAVIESEMKCSLDAVLVVPTDGTSATYNGRFAEMWGFPADGPRTCHPDDILRHVLSQLVDPEGYAENVRRFQQPGSAAVPREAELRDGRVVETHSGPIPGADGACLGRIFHFRDLTHQRRSEGALRASHALLAATERIAHVGGWEWDVARGQLSWSDEMCRIFGRDPATHVPTLADFRSAIHPDDRERVEQAMRETEEHGTPLHVEFRVVRPDGSVRVVGSHAETNLDAGGGTKRLVGTARDLTDQRAFEQELRFAHELSVQQLESSPDGILVVGQDRRIISYNRKFAELWDVPVDIRGMRCDEAAIASVLGRIKDPRAFVARAEQLFTHPETHLSDEIELTDGRVFERYSGPIPMPHDEAPGRIFFFRDITARKRAEENVARMARQDVLTGLANRGTFVEAVRQAAARMARGAKAFAVLYLDLDHFKDVNDTLGHSAGDLLLGEVAERLRSTVREEDIVARFGGDEFAVLQCEISEPAQVAALAERLVSEMRAPFSVLGNDIRVGVSIGMAMCGPGVEGAEVLMSQADLALYRAKADGRGTYRFFAEGMDVEVRARVALVSDLREGLDADQLFLVYQPQVDIATGRIVGVEALARWRHPRRGLVGPAQFIPVAEKSGLIVPLGRWVMRTACRQAKAWVDAGIAPELVAVNVSGAQFRTPLELDTTLASILAETKLPSDRLEVEFTESVLMEAWLEQRQVLENLRASGLRIAIDDFGTGFSSLQYLSRFPVDRIKIDRSFVSDIGEGAGAGNAVIVKATIGLARELGLQVIAEGVETRAQVEALRAWGCRQAQGYYFARPMPAEEVEVLLRTGVVRRPSNCPGTGATALHRTEHARRSFTPTATGSPQGV